MVIVSSYLSIITLNINGLNSPVQLHTMAEQITTQDSTICCLQETQFSFKDTHGFRVNWWGNTFHTNGNQKTARVVILILHKIEFKLKTVTRDKVII